MTKHKRKMQLKTNLLSSIIIFIFLISSAEAGNEQIHRLITQGAYENALVLVEKQLSQKPDEIQLLFLKGIIFARMDKLKQAESVFIDLTENYPELPEPFNNLAVIYAARGDYDSAEKSLRKAINTHPSYATAHENLGDIYAKMASQAYNTALKLDADNKETKQKLSMISDLISVPETEVEPMSTVQKQAPKPKSGHEAKSEPVLATRDRQPITSPGLQPKYDKEAARKKVETAIRSWANAWSKKDVDSYVKSYSNNFVPPHGLNRAAWKEQRHIRLNKPKFIKVIINNLNIEMLKKDLALASFSQSYQSDNYQDQVNKRLLMNNIDGIWLISKEESN